MNTSKKNFEPLKHCQLLLNKQIQSIEYIWEIVKLVSTSKSVSTSISTEATLSMNWDSIFRDLGRTVQIHFYKSQSVTYLDPELTFVAPVWTGSQGIIFLVAYFFQKTTVFFALLLRISKCRERHVFCLKNCGCGFLLNKYYVYLNLLKILLFILRTWNFFTCVCVFVMKAQNFPFGKVLAHFTSVCVLEEGLIFLVLAKDQHLVLFSLF